jgi:hypothetical protein
MNVSLQSTLPENLLMDSESERRVLSSMMHSEEACVEAYHALQSADFYSPKNASIFDLLCSLFERDIRPTYVELLKEAHSLGTVSISSRINSSPISGIYTGTLNSASINSPKTSWDSSSP